MRNLEEKTKKQSKKKTQTEVEGNVLANLEGNVGGWGKLRTVSYKSLNIYKDIDLSQPLYVTSLRPQLSKLFSVFISSNRELLRK